MYLSSTIHRQVKQPLNAVFGSVPWPSKPPRQCAFNVVMSTVHAHKQRSGRLQATARSLGISMAPPDPYMSHVYTRVSH